jgi:predicted hydrolase (HD superfamily)
MPLTRDQALQQLQAWTKNPSLLGHARSVEIVIRAAAAKYGGDPEILAITGPIHDADYDQWPDDHPKRYVDPLLVLTGEQYAKMPFETLLEKLEEAVRSGPRVVAEFLDSDGETHIFTDDE